MIIIPKAANQEVLFPVSTLCWTHILMAWSMYEGPKFFLIIDF